jgi:hypothetical protein
MAAVYNQARAAVNRVSPIFGQEFGQVVGFDRSQFSPFHARFVVRVNGT